MRAPIKRLHGEKNRRYTRSMRSKKKEVFFYILIVCGVLIFSIFLAEGVLRWVIPSPPFSSLFNFRPNMRLDLNPNIRGVSKTGVHSTNALGMRGLDIPSTANKRILAIGGSTTQCFFLDDAKIWTSVAQNELVENGLPDVWIGNAGIDGHSTRSHILLMEDLLPQLKPDMVLALVGINDLLISLSEDIRFQKNRFDRKSIKSIVYSKSKLFQVLYTWKLVLWDEVHLTQSNAHLNFVETPLDARVKPPPMPLEHLIPTLPEFENNLRTMIALAKKHQTVIVLMTQPSLFDDTPRWQNIQGSFYWIKKSKQEMSAATYWRLLNLYNQKTLTVCQQENIPCLDLASHIPHSETLFYDAVHFTEAGSFQVGQRVAEFLKPLLRPGQQK